MYHVIAIFSAIFLIILAFIFASSVDDIRLQQLILNCPYPIYDGIASDINLDSESLTITYTINYGSGQQNLNGTYFACYDANQGIANATFAPTVSASIKEYGATFVGINWGYLGFISDTLSVAGQKAMAVLNMLYLIITAPSQVSGLAFFTYINILLILAIGVSAFMIIRGSN